MTRIEYRGLVYVKITKEDWEFGGGETNPDLLKLKNRKRDRTNYRYFKLREHGQPPLNPEPIPQEDEAQAALRRWREDGVLP